MDLLKKIKSYFLSGIYIIFPIAVTFYLLQLLFSFLFKIIIITGSYFQFLEIAQIKHSQFAVVAIIIFILGATVKILALEKKIHEIEKKTLTCIPLLSNVYIGIKKIIAIFKNKNDTSTQPVVWVKVKDNICVIGFIVGKLEPENAPNQTETFYSIFIPATPNPVTGHYIIATEKDFYYNNLSRESALSIIISGGIIRPE
jgi:uncharacterized membrane protein